MEKLDHDFLSDDFSELDDVLDRSFFNDAEELIDCEEDEDNYENKSDEFRPISEL
ncbi:hypothetical protein [Marinoscillum sp.]|uniref:hypothetical protein n=1 Tax=Marinoscillum sp. TaxID=2024838 RepID=UPI003BABFEF1